MPTHATLYWSVCLVAVMALMASHQRVAGAASRMGGRPPAGAEIRQANAQPAAPALEQAVESAVQEHMLSKGVPSVSVAVMRDGKTVLQRAWGLADVDKKVHVNAATTYHIASVSKMFTAAPVLKQVDRARLSLNDTIAKHLSGLKPEFHAITIEQLLKKATATAVLYNVGPRVPGVADLVPRIVLGVPLPGKSK